MRLRRRTRRAQCLQEARQYYVRSGAAALSHAGQRLRYAICRGREAQRQIARHAACYYSSSARLRRLRGARCEVKERNHERCCRCRCYVATAKVPGWHRTGAAARMKIYRSGARCYYVMFRCWKTSARHIAIGARVIRCAARQRHRQHARGVSARCWRCAAKRRALLRAPPAAREVFEARDPILLLLLKPRGGIKCATVEAVCRQPGYNPICHTPA